MELLVFLGIGLIVLGSLSGISIYVDTFIQKANVEALWWLFVLSIIGGAACYFLGDNSFMGVIYSSYILLLLGVIGAITIFFTETGLLKEIDTSTLWVFFLVFTPIGAAGIFYESIL